MCRLFVITVQACIFCDIYALKLLEVDISERFRFSNSRGMFTSEPFIYELILASEFRRERLYDQALIITS